MYLAFEIRVLINATELPSQPNSAILLAQRIAGNAGEAIERQISNAEGGAEHQLASSATSSRLQAPTCVRYYTHMAHSLERPRVLDQAGRRSNQWLAHLSPSSTTLLAVLSALITSHHSNVPIAPRRATGFSLCIERRPQGGRPQLFAQRRTRRCESRLGLERAPPRGSRIAGGGPRNCAQDNVPRGHAVAATALTGGYPASGDMTGVVLRLRAGRPGDGAGAAAALQQQCPYAPTPPATTPAASGFP